jgi:hypothetical protein
VIQAYAVILATLNAFALVRASSVFSFHLSIVSFALLAVYVYRDVWPLMTYTLRPADEIEGRLLWAKITLIMLAGLVLPLFEPYPYIPVDPAVRLCR